MIDSLLIDKVYQPISDKVMDWTHRSCFWLAAHSIGAAPVAALVLCLDNVRVHGLEPFVVVQACVVPLVVWWCRHLWREAEKEQSRLESGAMTLRNDFVHRPNRMIWLAFFGLDVVCLGTDVLGIDPAATLHDSIGLTFSFCFLSYYCFMACRPKPPRRQRQTARGPVAFEGAA